MGRCVLMWDWAALALEGGFLVFCDPVVRKVQKNKEWKDVIYMVMYIKGSLFHNKTSPYNKMGYLWCVDCGIAAQSAGGLQ